MVKTDGTYLYILDGTRLNIVRAVPASAMELVSSIELEYAADEMYMNNDVLVVLGHPHDGDIIPNQKTGDDQLNTA